MLLSFEECKAGCRGQLPAIFDTRDFKFAKGMQYALNDLKDACRNKMDTLEAESNMDSVMQGDHF
jgi:hypothetical protein